MSRSSVLICTSSDTADGSIAAVESELASAGVSVVRLEADRYPVELRLSAGLAGGRLVDRERGLNLDLRQVRSVWLRHAEVGARVAEQIDERYRAAALSVAEAGLWSSLESLGVPMVDPPSRLDAFPGTLPVLGMARTLGLEVPTTLVSNDPDQVLQFCFDHPEGVVAKMLTSTSVELEGGVESTHFSYELGEREQGLLDSLPLGPMVFQSRVAKAYELRVTLVGGQLFVARIDSGAGTGEGQLDWRRDPELIEGLQIHDALPKRVGEALLGLTHRLGLSLATADLIVTPAGQHVFLELNTLSYFDFVERATGMPIARAVAELLLRPAG